MHPLMVRYIVYPTYKFVQGLKGYRSEEYHKELMESQWFTPSQLEELQQEKLCAILEHAYKNVPYYRKVFDTLGLQPRDIKDKEDLDKLPLLKKDYIRENPSAFLAKNISEKEFKSVSTSGTTGQPLKLFKDKNMIACKNAARYRVRNMLGFEHGDKLVSIKGHSYPEEHILQRFQKILKNEFIPYGCDTSEEKIGNVVEKTKKYNPDFIRGYPSPLYMLAKYMEYNGIGDLTPKNIWTYSEILYDYQRELIEKQFNCEVFDWFGFRESSMYLFECLKHTGYHVTAENGIIEIIRGGSHVSTGELGAVVLTDFTNLATPLIRYVTEDLAIYSGKLCPCGRGLPVIAESIDGRFSDCISTSKGFVLPRSVVSIFSDIETIKDFQVIQKTKERILVNIVKEQDYSANDTGFIINSVQKLIGSDINIEVKLVNSIPLTASGKKRFVISETQPEFVSDNNTDTD